MTPCPLRECTARGPHSGASVKAEEGRNGEVLSCGSIDNTKAALAKLLQKLGKEGATLHLCYEASGCGYGVYRQILDADTSVT